MSDTEPTSAPPHPDPAEEIARLKKALEPFARAGDPLETVEEWEAYCRSSGMVYSFPAEDTDPIQDWKNELTVGDLRRARAALSGSRSPQTNELDKVRNLICEYWDADEQANAHRTICDLHDVLFPNNPTIRRKQRGAPMPSQSEPTEEIVARLETDTAAMITGMALTPFASDIFALIASWRERGEALKPFAEYAEWVSRNHSGWDHNGFEVGLADGELSCCEANTLAPYRRARAVLAGSKPDRGEER